MEVIERIRKYKELKLIVTIQVFLTVFTQKIYRNYMKSKKNMWKRKRLQLTKIIEVTKSVTDRFIMCTENSAQDLGRMVSSAAARVNARKTGSLF